MKHLLLSLLVLLNMLCVAQQPYGVTIRKYSDPDALHPTNHYSTDATQVLDLMFQSLTAIDPYTLQEIPMLAITLPVERYDARKDETTFTYEIKSEARWDNGLPITAADVAFTFKFIKCPDIRNEVMRPYFEKITDVITYPEAPRKVTFVCSGRYILNSSFIGQAYILPQYIYDEEGVLNAYTIPQLNAVKRYSDKKLEAYGERYNGEKYQREGEFIVGSGAYRLNNWVPAARITLTKKEGWWADKLAAVDKNVALTAYPDTISYIVITDDNAAVTAMKTGMFDVLPGMSSAVFVKDVKGSAVINEQYNLYNPEALAYSYIGINMNSPKLKDVKVRQALAHLVDVDSLLQSTAYGFGTKITGPFSPLKKDTYNDTITPYAFSINKAKQLLKEAGWKSKRNKSVLTKRIDGKKAELELVIIYPAGNTQREKIGLQIKEMAAHAGIKITIQPLEWTIFLERTQHHDFDMAFGAWAGALAPDDPRQIWHTNSYNDGSNYVGFGNAESDKLIEHVVTEPDAVKRKHLYDRLQVIIHEEVPYIFLWAMKEKIAIHKRFVDFQTFSPRPGFNPALFQLK